jgi:predicted TIM-barrel fold metal-dependent hydrolase
MPTQSAANHIRHFGIPKGLTTYFRPSLDLPMKEGGISILTENGELKGETKEVLNLIAEHRQILATAHLSVGEILVLVDEAKRIGVEKIVITHPEFEAVNMPIDTQKLADKGAYLEYNFVNCTPIVRYPINPDTWAKAIKEVGAENCVMATDLGQPANPPPSEGLRSFIRLMLDRDITKEEIRLMVNENPRKLLDIT